MRSSSSSIGAASARNGCRSYELKTCLQRHSINIALLRSGRNFTCVETLAFQFALAHANSLYWGTRANWIVCPTFPPRFHCFWASLWRHEGFPQNLDGSIVPQATGGHESSVQIGVYANDQLRNIARAVSALEIEDRRRNGEAGNGRQ